MKRRYGSILFRIIQWLLPLALILLPGFVGCSSYHEHHKYWIGVFMFDSATAGAVLLEYDKSAPKGNTFGEIEEYNVNVDLFRYDFSKKALTKDRRLFKDMKDAGMYRVTEYNPPYLLQGARYGEETVLFNLATGEKRTLGVRVNHLSQEKLHFSNPIAIINSEKMDTVLYLSEKDDPHIYFFSENGKKYIGSNQEKVEGLWRSQFQLYDLNTDDSYQLNGFPRVNFSEDLVINWTENIAPFYSIYPDSASIGCNIDSLLNGKALCDTFPRSSVPLNRLTGSFKTRYFIGIREDGLYECTGSGTCEPRQISNGGYSEK